MSITVCCGALHSIKFQFQCFRDAIKAAQAYKNNSTDFMDEIMKELDVSLIFFLVQDNKKFFMCDFRMMCLSLT